MFTNTAGGGTPHGRDERRGSGRQFSSTANEVIILLNVLRVSKFQMKHIRRKSGNGLPRDFLFSRTFMRILCTSGHIIILNLLILKKKIRTS